MNGCGRHDSDLCAALLVGGEAYEVDGGDVRIRDRKALFVFEEQNETAQARAFA
jgi:hypothetical protein